MGDATSKGKRRMTSADLLRVATGQRILGVDLGATGAVALSSPAHDLLDLVDVPTLDDGPAGRRRINAPLLASVIDRLSPARAYAEFIGPMPHDGHVGAFAFGRARGVLEGVLAAQGVLLAWITVPSWRRAVGLPGGATKDQARSAAISRWPTRADLFARKRDDGRAEAALVAVAGLTRELKFKDVA